MDPQIKETLEKLYRNVTVYQMEEIKSPTNNFQSTFGKVSVYKPEEKIPIDIDGNEMFPLAQLNLIDVKFLPEALHAIKIMTVFVSQDFPNEFEEMGARWVLREYYSLEGLEIKELENKNSPLIPHFLSPIYFNDDCPISDSGVLDDDTLDLIDSFEDSGMIDSYYDVMEHHFETKIGGYPSFNQPGIDYKDGFGKGFEYVFQISSNVEGNFNVVDNGSLMFAKNMEQNKWNIYYDFL